jgi:hypothetical protein
MSVHRPVCHHFPLTKEPLRQALWRQFIAPPAMLPHLLHRSVVINLDGESYRLRDHHAATETSDTPPPAPANRYTEPAIR